MSARLARSSRPLPSLFVAFLSFFVFPWPSPLRVINVIIIIIMNSLKVRQGDVLIEKRVAHACVEATRAAIMPERERMAPTIATPQGWVNSLEEPVASQSLTGSSSGNPVPSTGSASFHASIRIPAMRAGLEASISRVKKGPQDNGWHGHHTCRCPREVPPLHLHFPDDYDMDGATVTALVTKSGASSTDMLNFFTRLPESPGDQDAQNAEATATAVLPGADPSSLLTPSHPRQTDVHQVV